METLLLLELAQLTAENSHFPFTALTVLIIGFIAAATIGSIAWYSSQRVVGWKNTTENQEKADVKKEKSANYDRNIISAETSARMKREGDNFKKIPDSENNNLDTTKGYTVSREGLLNNYAVEPEMYVNEPGDLREKQEAEKAERVEELKEVNTEGGKGPGIV